jgi:hypothetical protein
MDGVGGLVGDDQCLGGRECSEVADACEHRCWSVRASRKMTAARDRRPALNRP